MYHSKLLPWFTHFNVLSGKLVIFLFSLNQNTVCCSFCAQISVFNTWKILFCVKSHFILTLKVMKIVLVLEIKSVIFVAIVKFFN